MRAGPGEKENNPVLCCLWSQRLGGMANHKSSYFLAGFVCVCLCVAAGELILVLGCWVFLLLCTTHTSLPHTNAAALDSQSLPLLLCVAFTCVTLHMLPWWSLMLPPPPLPSTDTLCLCSSSSWLVAGDAGRLQTSSLSWEKKEEKKEIYFYWWAQSLPKLPNIFMEAHLIPACSGNVCPPHAGHISLPFISQNVQSLQVRMV